MKPTKEEAETFVRVLEMLDRETLCLVAAQAILRAAEKPYDPNENGS